MKYSTNPPTSHQSKRSTQTQSKGLWHPTPPPQALKIIQHANDVQFMHLVRKSTALAPRYQPMPATSLPTWKNESCKKSTVTLFTPDTKEAKIHPQVKIKNQVVKLDKEPKILVVFFSTSIQCIHLQAM